MPTAYRPDSTQRPGVRLVLGQPGELGAGEVRVEPQPGQLGDRGPRGRPSRSRSQISAVRRSCQTIARRGDAQGLAVPQHHGLALVGDADAGEVAGVRRPMRRGRRASTPASPARSPRARARPSRAGGSAGRTPGSRARRSGRPRVTTSAVTPVVPASMARTVTAGAVAARLGRLSPQQGEHPPVDPARGLDDAHLVVLGAGPARERVVPGSPGAGRRARRRARPSTGDLLVLGSGCRSRGREVQQPAQLGDRVGVVVDPQVGRDVVAAAVPGAVGDHQQRRGLPAAPVAAGVVAGGERGEQPPGQRLVGRSRPRRAPSPRRPRGRRGCCPGSRTPSPVTPPAQSQAAGAGVGRRAAVRVDDAEPGGASRSSSASVSRVERDRAVAPSSSSERPSARRRGWRPPGSRSRRRRRRRPGRRCRRPGTCEATATPHGIPPCVRPCPTIEKVMARP